MGNCFNSPQSKPNNTNKTEQKYKTEQRKVN